MHRIFLLIALCLIRPASSAAQPPTVLIENFSINNCAYNISALPEFEAIQANDATVLVLNCHIDFTETGETLGTKDCQARYGGYSNAHHRLVSMIPMTFINGRYDTSGRYMNAVKSAVKLAHTDPEPLHRTIKKHDSHLTLSLPALNDNDRAQTTTRPMTLWFFAYDENIETQIQNYVSSGFTPNMDQFTAQMFEHMQSTPASPPTITPDPYTQYTTETKHITYPNIVRVLKELGSWHGRGETITINVDPQDYDDYLIVAQDDRFGPIRLIATTHQ